MSGGFIWYELVTPDADASKAFYDAVVGWTIEPGSSFPNGYRMIGRGDGKYAGGLLPMTEEMQAHGARPIWLGYLHVDDVDATVAAIEGDGGKTVMPAMDAPGVGRFAMVTDPVGVPFYVMTPSPPPGQPDAKSDVFDPDKPHHIRWNELSTTDQDGAIAFFQKHFGWTQDGAMPMGEFGDYKFVQADGVTVGGVMRKMPQMPQSAWTTYFGVDDIDRGATAIRDGGGTVINGPMEIPGGDHAVVATDPHGALFGIVGPRREGAAA